MNTKKTKFANMDFSLGYSKLLWRSKTTSPPYVRILRKIVYYIWRPNLFVTSEKLLDIAMGPQQLKIWDVIHLNPISFT